MPRKAPDAVTEHRLTLGTYEREKLKEYRESAGLAQLPQMLLGGAAVGLVGIVGYGGYLLFKMLDIWPETTPEQEAVADRVFNVVKSYDPDRPEDAILGTPKDRAQLDIMLAQNQAFIAERLNKSQALIDVYSKLPVVGAIAAKQVAKAQEYVNTGHAKEVELLNNWQTYHTQRIAGL